MKKKLMTLKRGFRFFYRYQTGFDTFRNRSVWLCTELCDRLSSGVE